MCIGCVLNVGEIKIHTRKQGVVIVKRSINMVTSETLMDEEVKIWKKHSIRSGSQLAGDPKLMSSYRKEVKIMLTRLKVRKRSLSERIHDELEDENWHTLNATLGEMDYFRSKRLNTTYKNLRGD